MSADGTTVVSEMSQETIWKAEFNLTVVKDNAVLAFIDKTTAIHSTFQGATYTIEFDEDVM